MPEDEDRKRPDDEVEAPTQEEGAGEEGLGTRTGAVDGPQEGGPGAGQEEGSGGKADVGESGRGRH